MAGVVLVSNFVVNGKAKKDYGGIIDYYARYDQEKKENEIFKDYLEVYQKDASKDLVSYLKENDLEDSFDYGNYVNYMNKNTKASGLFGDDSDYFNLEQKENMKTIFNNAQKNGSVMWGHVFTFENDFLIEQGLLDKETNYLNEIKVKQAVRESMRTLIKKEGLSQSSEWCGEIHYDTDNIHIHTSLVEKQNTRPLVLREIKKKIESKKYKGTGKYEFQPKGQLKAQTLDHMKSKFASKLIDRSKDLSQLNELRNTLHHSMSIKDSRIEQMKTLHMIKNHLPENKKDWTYNNKKMDQLRPLIDQYTEKFLEKNFSEDFKTYQALLDRQSELNKYIYGEGRTERYKDTKENKMAELKSRMGNELLRQLKEADSLQSFTIKKEKQQVPIKNVGKNKRLINRKVYEEKYHHKNFKSISKQNVFVLKKINKGMRKVFRSEERELELMYKYQQLEQEIEQATQQNYER